MLPGPATNTQAVSVYSSLNNQTDKEEPPTKKRRFFTETENGLINDYFKPNKDLNLPWGWSQQVLRVRLGALRGNLIKPG